MKNCGIKRETANKLLDELIERVKTNNGSLDLEKHPRFITKVYLFGSLLNSNKDKVGDIDLFVKTVTKFKNEKEERMFFLKHPNNKSSSYLKRLSFALDKTLTFIRSKQPAFSFSGEMDYDFLVIEKHVPVKLIFEDNSFLKY